jgi:hypothetical protein
MSNTNTTTEAQRQRLRTLSNFGVTPDSMALQDYWGHHKDITIVRKQSIHPRAYDGAQLLSESFEPTYEVLVNGTYASPFLNFVPSQEENDINEFLYGMYFHEYNTEYGRQHDVQYRHNVMIPDNITRLLNERELKTNEKERKEINKLLHEEIMKLIQSKNMLPIDRFSVIQHKNNFRSGTIYSDSMESEDKKDAYYKYLLDLKNENRRIQRMNKEETPVYKPEESKIGGKRRKTRRQNKRKRRCTTKKRVRWAR